MISRYLLVTLISVITGCQEASNSHENYSRVVLEVTDMLHKYHLAIKIGGLEAEFDYLDDTENFFWVPPGYPSALNFDSVAAVLRSTDPSIAATTLHWDTLKVVPLRDDLAQFYGTISMQSTDTTGNITTGQLVETGLVIKRSDGWKLLSGQSAFFESL